MVSWMAENFGTIIVAILLVITVAAAILSIIKNKKAGRFSCSGDCAQCMMQTGCRRTSGGDGMHGT